MGIPKNHIKRPGTRLSYCGRAQVKMVNPEKEEATCQKCLRGHRSENFQNGPELDPLSEVKEVQSEVPSREQIFLLGLMERRIGHLVENVLDQDCAPGYILSDHPFEEGQLVMLGAIIEHLYPQAAYGGQKLIKKLLQEKGGWPKQ